jgi:hypothetical protein
MIKPENFAIPVNDYIYEAIEALDSEVTNA